VKDSSGVPVPGATVSFAGTTLTTGARGIAGPTTINVPYTGQVTVKATGYQTFTQTITAKAQASSGYNITLTPTGAPASSDTTPYTPKTPPPTVEKTTEVVEEEKTKTEGESKKPNLFLHLLTYPIQLGDALLKGNEPPALIPQE
jgi:hypothetical protein